jgi:hypothetical protein
MTGPLVVLRGGLALPAEPILFALELERRGFRFRLDDEDHELLIAPASRLTDSDREQLHTWRRHLRAIVDYCASATVN